MALKGKLEWVVLDESDRLLDLGLGSQVEQIIQMVRANQPKSGIKRDGITWQSLLVSATINDKVEKMASKLLGGDSWVWARASKSTQQKGKNNKKDDGTGTSTDPTTSNADSSLELSSATPKQLTQHHMVVSSKLRLATLISFLTTRIQMKERIVVFMSTCDGVDFHHKLLSHMQPIVPWEKGSEDLSEYKSKGGIFGSSCKLYRLHGNIPHKERHNIMSQFSDISKLNKEAAIMITTDVAARGLNLPSVNWIVQYDPPCETADYIHRAGRAARAGKAGHALLFLLPSELQYVEVLKIRGLSKLTALSLSSTLQAAAKICPDVTEEGLEKSGLTRANTNRIGEAFSSAVQLRLEDCILNNNKAYKESLSKKALPHGSDKEQKRRQKREAKNAIGPLLESARLAFSAYIRGYSAKEKCVKHIFSARALHLGHVAKSFALREQPKELSKAHRERRQANKGDGDELKSTGRKRSSQLAFGQKRNDKRNRKEDTDADEAPDTGAHTQHNNMPKSSRAISFLEASSSNDTGHKRGRGKNIKANMLAAASRMEEGDMEFF
jgi:ATP-dependent RNA helicase DDX31/DBP7